MAVILAPGARQARPKKSIPSPMSAMYCQSIARTSKISIRPANPANWRRAAGARLLARARQQQSASGTDACQACWRWRDFGVARNDDKKVSGHAWATRQYCIIVRPHFDDSEDAMNTLTVSARGQVTFRKELLQHLGIGPGEKIEIDWLPGGQALLQAVRPTASIARFVGLLADRTGKRASIEEIDAAAAQGWAGKK